MINCWYDTHDQLLETGTEEDLLDLLASDAEKGYCLLEEGHEGPHVFTPMSQIGLVFTGDEEEVP